MGWIDRVAERLDLPDREKNDVLEELADHFELHRMRLIAEGRTEEEARAETERALGNPGEVAATLQSVHSRAGWKCALASAAPFLLFALLPMVHIFSDFMRPFWGLRLDTSGPVPVYVCGTGAAAVIASAAIVIVAVGVGMLCMALRETRRGWYKQWVVTTLAVGAILPAWVMIKCGDTSALWRALHLDRSTCGSLVIILGISYALLSLAMAVISASGLRNRTGWTSALAAIVGVGCTILGYQVGNMVLLIIIPAGCAIALALLTGWRVFAQPVCGNAAHWAMFGFSVFMSVVLVLPGMMLPGTALGRLFGFTAAGILTACVSCIAFARCEDWRWKKLVLMPGILVGSLLIAFADDVHIEIWKGINVAEQCALVAAALVFGAPAVYGLMTSRISARPLYDE